MQNDLKGLSISHSKSPNLDFEILPIESVPVVSELLEVFPNDLLVFLLNEKFDFGIDFLPDRNPISICTY